MPRKRRDATDLFSSAVDTAEAIHQQDQLAETKAQQDRGRRSLLALKHIRQRETDTRPLRPNHVQELAESIAALGLIEPLVIDNQNVLLAGAHRLAAITHLKTYHPQPFADHFADDLVPVRIMPFDAGANPEKALQVELAENEKRVNYSRDQIEKLASRLRDLNYKETRGRPKKGEKALGPALAVAIGVSTRYVRKVLGEEKAEPTSKNRNSDPIFRRRQLLKKMEHTLQELDRLGEASQGYEANQALDEQLPELLIQVQMSLEELRDQ
jgi:ParB family chromosome partitioning protein